MRVQKSVVAAGLAIGLASSVAANDVKLSNNAIELKSSLFGDQVKMTVTGPKNFSYTAKSSGGDTVLSIDEINAPNDGLYKYEFVELKTLGEETVTDDFNGRGTTTRKIVEAKKVSGHFRIANGVLVNSNKPESNLNGSNELNAKNQ